MTSLRLKACGWQQLLLLGACAVAGFSEMRVQAAEPLQRELVIGRVTPNPGKHHKDLRQMLDYVVARMSDLGVSKGVVRMAKNNRQMVSLLRRGEVDWISETSYSALQFNREAGAELFLRRWKKGVSSYHSIIFVRADSGIDSLPQLLDQTVAFEDPGSTTGFFLPAATLIKEGLSLERLYSPREDPLSGYLGYAFSNAEITTAMWVYRGIVKAGAFSNLDWQKEKNFPSVFRKSFKVIHETNSVPRALEVVRGDLATDIRDRLRSILLGMSETPDGIRQLGDYQDTTQFDAIPDADLARLEELRSQITKVAESL